MVQLDAPALEVDPVGQVVQLDAPAAEYVPAAHVEQLVTLPPLEYVPAEQLTHEEPLIYCPGSHEMFALDPVHTPVVVQLVQVRLLPTYKVEQDLQADAFVVVEYVPVEHVRQLDPLRYVPAEHVGEQFPFSDTDPVGSAKANFCIVP